MHSDKHINQVFMTTNTELANTDFFLGLYWATNEEFVLRVEVLKTEQIGKHKHVSRFWLRIFKTYSKKQCNKGAVVKRWYGSLNDAESEYCVIFIRWGTVIQITDKKTEYTWISVH